MPSKLSMLSLMGTASAIALGQRDVPPTYNYLPIEFEPGYDSRFTTKLIFGTSPNEKPVQVVVDTGSINFWTWQPQATIYWGSKYLHEKGPCNLTVPTGYDPATSSTGVITQIQSTYAYGGNGKIVEGYQAANDTVAVVGSSSVFSGAEFALASQGIIRRYDDGTCAPIKYDRGILGLAPYVNDPNLAPGPLFRKEMYDRGVLASQQLFLWMDKYEGPLGGTYTGGLLFDVVDHSKYTGELVAVAGSQAPNTVGPYVARPNITINGDVHQSDSGLDCLVDSGSHYDVLPFDPTGPAVADFLKSSGLVDYYGIFAYNGTCDAIPTGLNITYTFASAGGDRRVPISIPLRNFARGFNAAAADVKGLCVLSLEYGQDCLLGATFLTGAALLLDDSNGGMVSLAQGGVASLNN